MLVFKQLFTFLKQAVLLVNKTMHIRHQMQENNCLKLCHICLISTGVKKGTTFKCRLEPLISSLQNRLLKVCYVPTTSTRLPRLLFLLQSITVFLKQTRQAVCAFRQSILLRCLIGTLTTRYL
jgi:hypothetical protein